MIIFALMATVGTLVFASAMASSPRASLRNKAPLVEPVPGEQVRDSATGLASYVVMLRANAKAVGPEVSRQLVITTIEETVGMDRMRYLYEHVIAGFSAWMTADEARLLKAHPDVLIVEPDMYCSTSGSTADLDTNPNEPDPWNLRRISSPDGLAPSYDPCGADGQGVTAIVIDTGIALDQTLFDGRIRQAISFVEEPVDEGDLHGTHVAGTIAASEVGVASSCDIVALKAGSELTLSYSALTAAMNWVADPMNQSLPSVVNLSISSTLGNQSSLIQFNCLLEITRLGIPIVAAASNNSNVARWQSFSSNMLTIAVGATDLFDQPAVFSNYGPGVDIWAPGVGILSADSKHPDGGLAFSSGTSMAAPCVSGVVALFLERHVTAEQIQDEDERPLIPSRAHIALARSSVPVLVDVADPLICVPGGTGTMAGSANQLVQACDGSHVIDCDEQASWHGNTASIILGDGISAIPPEMECVRTIRNAAGPIELTINTISMNWENAEPLVIEDVASGEILFNSDELFEGDPLHVFYSFTNRTFVSSSRQGLRVVWPKQDEPGVAGYGYVMTANVRAHCAGDIGETGAVEIGDLLSVLESWGPCDSSVPCMADLAGNGEVGSDDLLILIDQWGQCPAYVPPGFISDCNGNLVPGGLLGDGILDQGQREIRMNPIFAFDTVTPVDLNCAEWNWDSLEGSPFVISPQNPVPGACRFADGTCEELAFGDCQDVGQFWGAGVSCDSVPYLYDMEEPLCFGNESQIYGWPIPEEYDLDWLTDEAYTTFRQVLEPGVYSISRLAWVGESVYPHSMSKTNMVGSFSPLGVALSQDIVFAITIYYADGGGSDVIRRVPIRRPDPSWGQLMHAFVIEDLLPTGDREIHSIEIATDPDAVLTQSSFYQTPSIWALPVAENADVPLAEQSSDGGRTWYPLVIGDSANMQLNLCITP